MLATELLTHSAVFAQHKLSKQQLSILEAGLFSFICDELKKYFIEEYNHYFQFLKATHRENDMSEEPLARSVVKDIISSGMYTLSGIACYAHTSEDVLVDIVSGQNRDPSSTLFTNIIKLHQSVRPELYREILRKLVQG